MDEVCPEVVDQPVCKIALGLSDVISPVSAPVDGYDHHILLFCKPANRLPDLLQAFFSQVRDHKEPGPGGAGFPRSRDAAAGHPHPEDRDARITHHAGGRGLCFPGVSAGPGMGNPGIFKAPKGFLQAGPAPVEGMVVGQGHAMDAGSLQHRKVFGMHAVEHFLSLPVIF